MRLQHLRVAVFAIALIGAGWPPVFGRPPHKKALAEYLGPRLSEKLNDCRTCHVAVEDGTDAAEPRPHNPFGKRLKAVRLVLKKAGKSSSIAARVEAIANEDSDGDGVSNLLELVTGHFPGEGDDRPADRELQHGHTAISTLRMTQAGYPWNPFERVARPAVPLVHSLDWVRNPIDHFISAEQQARGLIPRGEASRPVLLRRLYLELTGLPPTPSQLHDFLADRSPDAYERIVDRLLASPAYGERWGRHWMDIWRYSDWAGWGKQVRDSQPHIWHWRDWIVEALNRDQPYDRVIVAMLAADEVNPDDLNDLRATGYLARNFKLLSREKWMQDVVDHTGQAFLGVTLGCARCHDHMYDPILQKEYYQFRAIFEPHQVRVDHALGVLDTTTDGIPRAFDAQLSAPTRLFSRGDDRNPTGDPLNPGVPEALGGSLAVAPIKLTKTAVSPDRRSDVICAQREALVDTLAKAETKLRELELTSKGADDIELTRLDVGIARAKLKHHDAIELAEALLDKGQKDSKDFTEAATGAVTAQRNLALALAHRGELAARVARRRAKPRERATADLAHAAALKALAHAEQQFRQPPSANFTPLKRATYPPTSTGRRLALARWITDSANPLTARVAANHLWGRHFGRAIVPSVNDFGRNGQRPSHPALLDWLAMEFMDRGWSMKAIHRLIVTSATYRQDSKPDATNLTRDPDNVFLWRWAPRRAEAEVVRDCLFAVAGGLDSRMGGPAIDHSLGLMVPRRSLYFQHAAEKQMEFLQIFDGAGVTECYRRKESILPQQALALANSDLSLNQARSLAKLLSTQAGQDNSSFITAAFEHVLGRYPTGAERDECLTFLHTDSGWSTGIATATKSADDPESKLSPAGFEIRRRQSLVHVLLNHHDFVTIR